MHDRSRKVVNQINFKKIIKYRVGLLRDYEGRASKRENKRNIFANSDVNLYHIIFLLLLSRQSRAVRVYLF